MHCSVVVARVVGVVGVVFAVIGLRAPAFAETRDAKVFKVCIQPLGAHDKALMRTAARGIEYLYGFQVTMLPAKPLPKHAYYPPRKRYRADRLIRYLRNNVVQGSGCDAVVGFTKVDISTTKGKVHDWGILGLGYLGGDAAVVSSFRMRAKSSWTRKKRAIKVTNHELGHVLGLEHYSGPHKGCLMSDGKGTVRTVDKEHGLLCPESREQIERNHGVKLPRHKRFNWKKVLR